MQNLIILKTPASFWGAPWREALPSGNGRIGAAVYGGVGRERILLTHDDLWTGSRDGLDAGCQRATAPCPPPPAGGPLRRGGAGTGGCPAELWL